MSVVMRDATNSKNESAQHVVVDGKSVVACADREKPSRCKCRHYKNTSESETNADSKMILSAAECAYAKFQVGGSSRLLSPTAMLQSLVNKLRSAFEIQNGITVEETINYFMSHYNLEDPQCK